MFKKKVTILGFIGKQQARTQKFLLPEGKREQTPEAACNLILIIVTKNML